MPHQQLIADVGCEVLPDGSPAFREVIVTMPRQQGKTTLVLSFEVERCNLRGKPQRVAYTAQSGSDARKKLIDDQVPILQGSPLWATVAHVHRAQGAEGVKFKNGSRIDVLASSVSAGHGKTIDLGVIDEAFDDVDDRREQAMLPAMITRTDAQLLVVSTMGTDTAVYLNRKVDAGRSAALEGRTSGIAYFEWSCPDDVDIDDPASWWTFMPALGRTVQPSAIEHARTTMSDGEFRRAFGNQRTKSAERVIPEATWRVACSTQVAPTGKLAFAVEVSPDRDWSAIAAASHDDGVTVVELIDYRPGTGWVRDRVEQLAKDHGGRVVLESRSPAAALGLNAEEITVADAVKASGAFYDGIADQRIKVRSDGRLDTALNAAAKQPVADSWRFGRKSMSDVSPLIAATFAVWAAGRSGAASFMY
jgi:hypothetical protein